MKTFAWKILTRIKKGTTNMKFLGYNIQTRDFKLFECPAKEAQGWFNAVFRDTHYTIIILKIKDSLFVIEKVVTFDPRKTEQELSQKLEYTRTQVKYHPLESKLEGKTDVFLSRDIKLQKENKPESNLMQRV